jgi:isopentenyldiphosphate isomerase
MPKVVIVDSEDNVIGAMERSEAIARKQIVRIVRVLLFNSKGQLFMQKRGPNVNFPNLWDQSVGGHVDEGEDYLVAARREMEEEIGLKGVNLKEVARYYTEFEYEQGAFRRFNMLYTALSDDPLKLNPDEVAGGKWVTLSELDEMITVAPENFTQGFIKTYGVYKSFTNQPGTR